MLVVKDCSEKESGRLIIWGSLQLSLPNWDTSHPTALKDLKSSQKLKNARAKILSNETFVKSFHSAIPAILHLAMPEYNQSNDNQTTR